MESLLASLSHALEGSFGLALGAALCWGVLSVVLSPCHLASIPLVVGVVGGGSDVRARRALGISVLFASGILASIAIVGVVTAALGRLLGDAGPGASYLVGAFLILIGLNLMGVLPLPALGAGGLRSDRRGAWAALVIGLVFGLAVGPCTFAYLAPVLAITFGMASEHLARAVLLLAAFAAGHGGVIVLAGTSSRLVQRYLDWSERSRGTIVLRAVCGVLVVLGGLWTIYAAP